MARKKTPGKDNSGTDTPVTTDEVSADATPETVDAEIVENDAPQDALREDGDAGATETVSASETDETPTDGPADDVTEDREPGAAEEKSSGGGALGWLVVLALLAIVAAAVFFGLRGEREPEVATADVERGVVVSEAEPIRGEAAPGTREAARQADAAASEGAPVMAPPKTGDNIDRDPPETNDAIARAPADAAPSPMDGVEDEGDDADAEPRSALVASAAARNQARREAREAARREQEGSAQEDDQDASAEQAEDAGDRDLTTAERIARARATQERMRQEDLARAAASLGAAAPAVRDRNEEDATETEAGDEPMSAADRIAAVTGQTEQAEAAQAEGEAETQAPSSDDDPNALPAFTEGEAGDAPEELAADTDDIPPVVTTRRRAAQAAAPATPQTGDEEEADDAQTGEDAAEGTRPRLIEPRPAQVATRPARPAQTDTDDRQGAQQAVQAPAPQPGLNEEELEQRLGAVRQDLRAETEQRIQSAISETEREVESLREALTEQEARADQRIAQLQDRLEVLQSRDASASSQGVLILALSGLNSALDQGQPFNRQLDDVERLAPQARSLSFARAYAAEGLPTDQVLEDRFQDTARRAQAAAGREDAEGVFGGLMANLKGLFTVRKRGKVAGDTPSAVISRAEVALERGDLDGAVDALSALEGEAAEVFEPWVEDARAKAEVRDRISRLERAVLAQR